MILEELVVLANRLDFLQKQCELVYNELTELIQYENRTYSLETAVKLRIAELYKLQRLESELHHGKEAKS